MTNASTESFFNRSLADVDPEIFARSERNSVANGTRSN